MRLFNNTKIDFVGKSTVAKFLSITLIIAGLTSLVIKDGPELSIDFTGGTIAQLQFNDAMDVSKLRTKLAENGFESSEIITFGSPNEVLIKTQFTGANSELKSNLKSAIKSEFQIRRVESVGPKIGKELQSDALSAILLSLLLILIYISFRFDRFYAYGSVVALIHDVLITMGVFSLFNIEIDLTIVAALLTIVGYSLNDTIVVFDRIRENVVRYARESLDMIVNRSLNSTLGRTIVTSLTTFLVVLSFN